VAEEDVVADVVGNGGTTVEMADATAKITGTDHPTGTTEATIETVIGRGIATGSGNGSETNGTGSIFLALVDLPHHHYEVGHRCLAETSGIQEMDH
jgi:hypothetical protein